MKIVLIANYAPDGSQSMGRYPEMLRRHLSARGHSVTVLPIPAFLGRFSLLRGGLKKWIGYIDKFLLAPFCLRWKCRNADLVHVCDHSNSMYLRCAGRNPQILTCHDLIAVNSARGRYPGITIGFTGKILQRWIASGIRSAQNLVCVSSKTRDDVLELAPDLQARPRVIYNPLNTNYHPSGEEEVIRVLAALGLPADTEYLFHVGGNQWYKNRRGVLEIFAELKKMPRFARTRLIMAGQPWDAGMQAFSRAALPDGSAIEVSKVPDRDLQAFYSGALALLFPSREEGFGWPVLEAQACGCPVITTNRPPMTEVAGDAALLIDPDRPQQAAETILRGLPSLRELRELGFENLKRFSAESAIDAYIAAYEEAAGRRISSRTLSTA